MFQNRYDHNSPSPKGTYKYHTVECVFNDKHLYPTPLLSSPLLSSPLPSLSFPFYFLSFFFFDPTNVCQQSTRRLHSPNALRSRRCILVEETDSRFHLCHSSVSEYRPSSNKEGEGGREGEGEEREEEESREGKNIDLVRQPIPPLEPPSLEAHVAEQDLELVLKTLVSEHRKGLGVSPPLSPFSLLPLSPLFFHFRSSLCLPLIFFFFLVEYSV